MAEERFKEVFKALSIAASRSFEFEILSAEEVSPQRPREKKKSVMYHTIMFPYSKPFEPNVLDEAKEILNLLQKSDEYSKKALDYFARGLTMRRWPSEAYLNFFKAIELISDKFIPELKKKLKDRINDLEYSEFKRLATRKRKIKNVLEIFNLNRQLKKDVGKLIKIRNKFDVAHPLIKEIKLDNKDVDFCMIMAKQIIISYLQTLKF